MQVAEHNTYTIQGHYIHLRAAASRDTCRTSLFIHAAPGKHATSVKHGQCRTQTCSMCNILNRPSRTYTTSHRTKSLGCERALGIQPQPALGIQPHVPSYRPDHLINTTMPFLNSLPISELKSHDEIPLTENNRTCAITSEF